MATVTVLWKASDNLRKSEIVATGSEHGENRKFDLDLTSLISEQRKPLIDFIGLNSSLNMHIRDVVGRPPYFRDTETVYFDAQPTAEQMVSWCQQEEATRQEIARRAQEHAMAEKAETVRLQAIYDAKWVEYNRLNDANDLEGLQNLSAWELTGKLNARSAVDNHIHRCRDEAITRIRKERVQAAIAQWIEEHGSEYLKRAFGMGYNCHRKYVIERAACEAPGFTVDYSDKAEWKDRSCPSAKALDEAVAAGNLGLGEARVVWLTNGPVDVLTPIDELLDDYFSPREAVVISEYLGKYNLVKIL